MRCILKRLLVAMWRTDWRREEHVRGDSWRLLQRSRGKDDSCLDKGRGEKTERNGQIPKTRGDDANVTSLNFKKKHSSFRIRG